MPSLLCEWGLRLIQSVIWSHSNPEYTILDRLLTRQIYFHRIRSLYWELKPGVEPYFLSWLSPMWRMLTLTMWSMLILTMWSRLTLTLVMSAASYREGKYIVICISEHLLAKSIVFLHNIPNLLPHGWYNPVLYLPTEAALTTSTHYSKDDLSTLIPDCQCWSTECSLQSNRSYPDTHRGYNQLLLSTGTWTQTTEAVRPTPGMADCVPMEV